MLALDPRLLRALPALLLLTCLLGGARSAFAQEPGSRPTKEGPAKPGEPEPAKTGEDPQDAGGQPKPLETPIQRQARILKETTVHFDFRRAPIEHILRALAKASEVPIALSRTAKRVLDKRKFKIKYVASRRGDQVLSDLCKAAGLDYVIRDKGVLVGLPGRIRKLRKAQGLGGKAIKLTPKDVTKALTTKSLSITATKRSLESVLAFLRSETQIPYVRLSEKRKKDAPPLRVTLSLTSVPLKELLDKILHPLGQDWIQQGRVILVGSAKAIAEQRKLQAPQQKAPQKRAPQEPAQPGR